jgi:hypothetical protein
MVVCNAQKDLDQDGITFELVGTVTQMYRAPKSLSSSSLQKATGFWN